MDEHALDVVEDAYPELPPWSSINTTGGLCWIMIWRVHCYHCYYTVIVVAVVVQSSLGNHVANNSR